MKYTHKGHTIEFIEKDHKYILDGEKELTSVTTFIHSFFEEFDKIAMAKKCVGNKKYKGLTEDQILLKWEEKGEIARNKGTTTHKYIEDYLHRGEGSRQDINSMLDNLLREYKLVDIEKVVFSPKYMLSGTVDAIFKHKKTEKILIADWKTSESIDKFSKYKKKGKLPIDNISDCNFNHYSLQLNFYKLLLNNEGYLDCFDCDMRIVHIKDKGYEEYVVDDFEDAISLMLLSRGLI